MNSSVEKTVGSIEMQDQTSSKKEILKSTKKRKLKEKQSAEGRAKKKKKLNMKNSDNSDKAASTNSSLEDRSSETLVNSECSVTNVHEQAKVKNNKAKKLKMMNSTEIKGDLKDISGTSIPNKKKKKRKLSETNVAKEMSNVEKDSEFKPQSGDVQHDSNDPQENKHTDTNTNKKKKKKKKNRNKLPKLSDERLLAYGINPKKLKFMKTDNYMLKGKE